MTSSLVGSEMCIRDRGNELLSGIHHLALISEELKNFEYTAVQVSVSEGMIPRRDGNDMGPSWTILMATFTG
eukprot:3893465-Prorocentrum_lima.AAC.1